MNNGQGTKGRGDPNKKIFIGGVPRTVSDEEYREYFSSFGDLDDCILMRDSAGICRGFGFVTYKEQSAYDNVFETELQLRGVKLEQKKAVPSRDVQEKESDVKVFIGGLATTVDKQALDDYFCQFGEIQDSIVMVDAASGKSRGFGFVTFADTSSVDELMNNPRFELCGKEVQCKRAQPAASLNRMRSRGRQGRQGGGYGGSYGRSSYKSPSFDPGYGRGFRDGDVYGQGKQFAGEHPGRWSPYERGVEIRERDPWSDRQGGSWRAQVSNEYNASGYKSNIRDRYVSRGRGAGYGGRGRFGAY